MPGQLVTYAPAPVNLEAADRTGPRGFEAIFLGFSETHGIIDNSAILLPLETLLLGTGYIRPLRTKDYRVPAERSFPLARLREWNLMLRSSKLVAECSKEQYQTEIDKLTDPTVSYVPTIIFEQPIGAAQRMGFKQSGPWVPDLTETYDIPALADLAPSSEPAVEQIPNDLIELGSYTVGGSSASGSGSSNAIATASAEISPAHHVATTSAVASPAIHEFSLIGISVSNFLRSLAGF